MDEARKKTSEGEVASELTWPKFSWNVTKWFTIGSFVIGALLLIFPDWSEGKFDEYRILAAVLIIMSPFLLFTAFPWILQAGFVTIKRVRRYTKLLEAYNAESSKLTELQKTMVAYLQNQINYNKYEIRLAAFKDGKLYILLPRHSVSRMALGDIAEVIDVRDSLPMGQFIVTEIRDEFYYAVGINHVDQVWLGYVRQQGETKFTPYLIAIHIPQGGKNG